MKKNVIIAFALFFLGSLILLTTPQAAFATCELTLDKATIKKNYNEDITIRSTGCFIVGRKYDISRFFLNNGAVTHTMTADSTDELTFPMEVDLIDKSTGTLTITVCYVKKQDRSDKDAPRCDINDNTIYVGTTSVEVGGDTNSDSADLPKLNPADQTSCGFKVGSAVSLKAIALQAGQQYHWWVVNTSWKGDITLPEDKTEADFSIPGDAFNDAVDQTVCVDKKGRDNTSTNCITLHFAVDTPSNISCDGSAPVPPSVDPPCENDINVNEETNPNGGCLSVNSAIGQLSTEPGTFIPKFLAIFLSLSGGIALLLIIRSGYQLLTSQGDAEKVKEARERITSAIIGILFMIFSLVILQTIGVDILHLPGFSK